MNLFSTRFLSIALLALTCASSAFAAPTPEYACLSAINNYTTAGNETDLTEDVGYGAIFFAGSYQSATPATSAQGLFFMTETENDYFPFPSAPSSTRATEFDLKIALPAHTPFYLVYQNFPQQEPSVTWSPSALEGVQYTAPTCVSATDASAESAITDFLTTKIATVTDSYNFELAKCSGTGHCRPKQDFLTALKGCQLAAVQPAIASALQSLNALPECGCPL